MGPLDPWALGDPLALGDPWAPGDLLALADPLALGGQFALGDPLALGGPWVLGDPWALGPVYHIYGSILLNRSFKIQCLVIFLTFGLYFDVR